MIRYSYFVQEIINLKKIYQTQNVLITKDHALVMVNNFKPAKFFKTKETSVVFEIPAGFGYGMNISNVYILLNKKISNEHLYTPSANFSKDRPGFEKSFNFAYETSVYKNQNWFWICFHFLDELGVKLDTMQAEDNAQEEYSAEEKAKWSKAEKKMVGMVEFMYMLAIVLDAIAAGDEVILRNINKMNKNHKKHMDNHRKAVKAFSAETKWRKLKWMY